jgi:hypothetical protein
MYKKIQPIIEFTHNRSILLSFQQFLMQNDRGKESEPAKNYNFWQEI